MITVEEALRRILERTPRLPSETVGLKAARGRVLREDVFADRDLPPFHRSAVDGYAVRAAVPRTALPALLLDIKARGGTDLVVSEPQQIVP